MDVHMKNLVQVQSIMASEHLSLVDLRTIVGLMEQSTRITSYNVCYTKLLRDR